MNMKTALTAALLVGALSLSGGLVIAGNLPARGPIPFATWDADGNGAIDEQEFSTVRAQRQAMVETDGRLGMNMAAAPTFAQMDSNGDGSISAEELTAVQTRQQDGKDRAWGNHGRGCGMKNHMGQRYQAMDDETRAKYDTFLTATSELRKEIAAKRAEKRAVMHSANPDPDQAAQLTRELLELRSRMLARADEAGLEMGPGSCGNCGHHNGNGKGYGKF